jgi:hypothetical protein
MAVNDQAKPEPEAGPQNRLDWDLPYLYGEAEAINSMGTIAAPLLAGFSLAAMVQTITINTSDARWPNVALLLFMLAAVLFVTTVQATFWARQYQTNPREIADWWPSAIDSKHSKELGYVLKWHAAGFRMWANRARVTYSAALLCLLGALTVLAVPPESHVQVPFWRWLAVAVGGAAFIAEIIWITGSFSTGNRLAWLLQPRPRDALDTSPADHEP